ncbi:hypothetical protein BGZ74_003532, partial [Mortierella antarctica]
MQRLPNECLLLIIECLAGDTKALKSLLPINLFFLHTALPLLIDKWLHDFSIVRKKRPHRDSMALFQELLLKSIVHYPQDGSPATTSTANTFLRGFGLQLTVPSTISGPVDSFQDCPKPMVDYSKFLSQLLPWHFQNVVSLSFKDIRLISLPPGRPGHTEESDLEESDLE